MCMGVRKTVAPGPNASALAARLQSLGAGHHHAPDLTVELPQSFFTSPQVRYALHAVFSADGTPSSVAGFQILACAHAQSISDGRVV